MWHVLKGIPYVVIVRKPERKSQLDKPRRRWQNDINTDVK
jgi:2-oxo-4-hydroxy-4-carboxy--5-ureidoimidazoline (OHCU) decarboxylase